MTILALETTVDAHTLTALRAITAHLNRQQPPIDAVMQEDPESPEAIDGTGPATMPLGTLARFGDNADAVAKHFEAVANEVGETATWRDVLLEQVFATLAKDDTADLAGQLVVLATITTRWAGDIFRRLEDENHADRAGRGTDR